MPKGYSIKDRCNLARAQEPAPRTSRVAARHWATVVSTRAVWQWPS
jgi:hypothetical protein